MKIFKILLFISFLVLYASVFQSAAAASALTVSTDKSSAKVGDTIQIRVALSSKPDKASAIYLYVSDAVINKDNYKLQDASLKTKWMVTDLENGADISFSYDWNTKVSQSKAGTHYITAIMDFTDPFYAPIGSNELSFTLAAADGSTTDKTSGGTTGSGSGAKTGSGAGSGTGSIPTEEQLRTSGKLGDYITLLIKWAIPFGLGAGALVIVYAGYVYMTGQGTPESTKYAKELILGVIVGLAIIILAGVILQNVIGVPGTLSP